jgi:hypothetical protein
MPPFRSTTGPGTPPTAGLAIALLVLAGCARMGGPEPGMAGSGSDGVAGLVEDRVWLDESPDAAPGSMRAFLSDGTLVMTSCVETYRLAPWRWVEGGTLVWEEDGRVLRAEIAVVERDVMGMAIDLGQGERLVRRFAAAEAPVVCPDLPR